MTCSERHIVDKRVLLFAAVLLCLTVGQTVYLAGAQILPDSKTASQQKLEALEAQAQTPQTAQPDAATELAVEDTTPRFDIAQIQITGNTLIAADVLLGGVPDTYHTTAPAVEAAYDLRPVKAVIAAPGAPVSISARTIQGFTQYLLNVYQMRHYAGVYVYVPAEAFETGKELEQGILPIRILEAQVGAVGTAYYDVDNQPVEKGYLRRDVLEKWSPVKPGKPINRRKLDEYLNLLNLNPDRYAAAAIAQGEQADTLKVDYKLYEANPWHFFTQIDNAGTEDTQWTPKFGLINTNLFGYDDKLTIVYQAVPDKTFDEEYAVYGSYDFPLFTPRLRLNVFGGHNEFDITGGQNITFIGRGSFGGATLRYNLFQYDKWFFDLTGTITHDQTKTTPSLFPEFLTSDVHLTMGGFGAQLYRTDDKTDTLLSVTRLETLDGSPQEDFALARTNSRRDFVLYNATARHSRYLDNDKVQRATGAFQYIDADERIAPSKMTSFGGMYTVRGYDEYEIIADGGILASLQYEYDIIRKMRVSAYDKGTADDRLQKPFIRKIAPLVFCDYGQARIKDALAAEHSDQELASIGGGFIVELTEHFTGTVYYGHPLIETENTRPGKGRLNAGLLFRW